MKMVALVTGSAKRVGREIALRLAAMGYFTWIHYQGSHEAAEKTLATLREAGGDGELVSGDISSPEEVRAMAGAVIGKCDHIDILVNNVGIYKTGPLADFSTEAFDQIVTTNLLGSNHVIQAFLPHFPASGGSIINLGYSGVDALTGTTHNTAYLISKTGLLVLTKSYAEALGPRGIRVNMVSPGILSNTVEPPKDPARTIPMGHMGSPADIADAVEFLVGDKARYVTGINLDVAGGYLLSLKALQDRD